MSTCDGIAHLACDDMAEGLSSVKNIISRNLSFEKLRNLCVIAHDSASYTYKHMIGRIKEIGILEKAMTSSKPELVAVIGRRRVGKTYLIRSFFEGKIDFEMVGLKDGNKEQQLRNFSYSLKEAKQGDTLGEVPKDWLEAFYFLKEYLAALEVGARKKVVFIDELPWIATAKSDFLTGFSFFWNSFASKNKDIAVVICGSATAWMIKKIINNKGGLHNRVTRKILLQAFSLTETKAYFESRNIFFDDYRWGLYPTI